MSSSRVSCISYCAINLLCLITVFVLVLHSGRLVAGVSISAYENIHNDMSVEELKSIFHVESHQEVPQYEVIHIHHKRSISPQNRDNNVHLGSSKIHNEKISEATYQKRQSFDKKNSNRINDTNNTNDNLHTDTSNSFLTDLNKLLLAYINSESVKSETNDEQIAENISLQNAEDDEYEDYAVNHERFQLEAFGKKFNLTLKPTENLIKKSGLKIFIVEPNVTSQHGVDYVEMESHDEEDIGKIYQDEENEAAILLRPDEKTKTYLVEGSIGKDLVIKPLPKHLRRSTPDLSDDEMFLNQDDLNSEVSIDTGLPIRRRSKRDSPIIRLSEHIIYKKQQNDDNNLGDYAFMEPDRMAKRYRRASDFRSIASSAKRRSKREAPYVIYPEILVIVDYDGYRLHGGDNLQIKRYFVSFWNGVDLRYKLLKGPKIRISIAGIIISRGRDATPYLERNRVGRDAIDSAAALTDMGKYLFKERRLPVYDIAVAITKLDMCRRQFANDVCNRGTAGFAYVGGACVVNKRLEKVNSVAIIEDTGGFSGIIVAAHEVGHLLGAVHDGSPPPSYLGGPGAEKCRWEDGYIMSDLRHTERGFRWSPCSIQSFHHFLNGDTATCLYNSPHEDENLARILPGKLLTLDAQCRKDRGTSACFKDDRVCAQLFCFDSGSGYCVAYRPAAEGSSCGDGQYCINGRCVAEHENIIPDYSQNTPSYIRRQDVTAEDLSLGLQNTAATEVRPLYAFNTTTQRYYYSSSEEPTTTTTTQSPYNYYQQYTTETTEHPYYAFYRTSTDNPSYYYDQSSSSTTENSYYEFYRTSTTEKPYYENKYTTRFTTKSPYDFNSYSKQTQTTPTTTTTTSTTPSTTTKTKSVFDYYLYTTKAPYQYFPKSSTTTTTTTTTTKPTTLNYYYTQSTTKNPYNYVASSSSTPNAGLYSTTKNPYIGDYYERINRTTKNPYDFGNFGRNALTKTTTTSTGSPFDFSNNYLKRSSNYYSAASDQIQSKLLNDTQPIVVASQSRR